jgi:hypothetical protein
MIKSMQNQKNTGLTFGLIAAAALVAFTTVLYLGGIKVYLSSTAYLGYIIITILAVLAAQRQKKLNGGYLEFRDALRISFTVLVLAILAQSLFNYVLFNFIDKDFKQAVAQASMEKTEEWLKKFGMPEEKISEAIEQERNKNQYSLPRVSLGFAVACIFQFLTALIIAAVTKKKNPEFPVS